MKNSHRISGSHLFRNTLFNLSGQLFPLLIGIFTIPIIVHHLGVERFGIFSLAWVILGYSAFLDLGLGRTATKFIAEALGKGDFVKIPNLIWTSVGIIFFCGLMGGIVFAGLIPLLVSKIFNITKPLVSEAAGTFLVIAITIPVVISAKGFQGVLAAGQRFDLINVIQIPSQSLFFLIPTIGTFFSLNLPETMFIIFISKLVTVMVYFLFCIRTFPDMKKKFCFIPKLIKPLFSYGGWITVSALVGSLSMCFDRFIIGSVMTMAAVSYFSTPCEMVLRLWIIPGSLVMTLFPAFSSLGATRKDELEFLFVRSHKYLLLGVGPVAIFFVIFARTILQIWLGDDFAQQSTVSFQILSVSALIGCMAPVSGGLIQGLGRPDIISKIYLFYFIPNAIIILILVHKIGITGAAVSFAIRVVIDTCLVFVIAIRLSKITFSSFSGSGFIRSTLLLFLMGMILWFVSFVKTEIFIQAFFVMVIIVLFYLFTWLWVLDRNDKYVIASIIRKKKC